jgi:hypothetical protein
MNSERIEEIKTSIRTTVMMPTGANSTYIVFPRDEKEQCICAFCGNEIVSRHIDERWVTTCDCAEAIESQKQHAEIAAEQAVLAEKSRELRSKTMKRALDTYKRLYNSIQTARDAEFREIDETILSLSSLD